MLIKKLTVFVLTVILLFTTCIFTGCMDLGNFETDEDYYESFGEITLYNEAGEKTTFDLKEDFYNEQTSDKMATSVDVDNYVYFCIEVKRNMVIQELALYEKCDASIYAEYSFFILKVLPTTVPSYDSVKPVLEEDDPFNSVVATVKTRLNYNMWGDFVAGSIGNVDENGKKTVKNGDIICIRFDNNTCYGKERELERVAFTLTDFMVRAIY